MHCKDATPKIQNKYSQEKELRGYSPNSYIHVSVGDLHSPLIGLPILLQENVWAEREYRDRSKTHECGNWDKGRAIPFLGIYKFKFLCSVS
jgi:hypothetical protein